MATSRKSEQIRGGQLTFSLEELPVRTSPLRDCGRDWMERAVTSRSNSLGLLTDCVPGGWYGRTSPACCRLTTDGHLEPLSEGWGNSGMGSPTEFLTLSTLEFHSGAVA